MSMTGKIEKKSAMERERSVEKSWKRFTTSQVFQQGSLGVVAMAINMPVTQQAFWHHTHMKWAFTCCFLPSRVLHFYLAPSEQLCRSLMGWSMSPDILLYWDFNSVKKTGWENGRSVLQKLSKASRGNQGRAQKDRLVNRHIWFHFYTALPRFMFGIMNYIAGHLLLSIESWDLMQNWRPQLLLVLGFWP